MASTNGVAAGASAVAKRARQQKTMALGAVSKRMGGIIGGPGCRSLDELHARESRVLSQSAYGDT